MFIVSTFGDIKKIGIVFGSLTLVSLYSILNNIAYGAEFGTYILSEMGTNKSLNTVENIDRSGSTSLCDSDKIKFQGKQTQCIWRVDKDYQNPTVKPIISTITPIVPTIPTIIIPPTLSVDKSEVTAGDTVTFKWDTKGGSGCYTTVDGVRSVTLTGATGYSVSEDVSAGVYAIGLNCPYGNIVKSAPIVIVTVKPAIIPPTLSVDKSEVTAGDTVTFSWNANNGKDCYTTVKINNSGSIDAFVKDNKEKGMNTGIITVEDVSPGLYNILLTCRYSGANRTSIPITVSIKNPVKPTLVIKEYGPYYGGDTITFDWVKHGGKNCYTTLNGKNAIIESAVQSGSIPIEDVPAGNYTISMSCVYNKIGVTSTELRTSDALNVKVN